MWLSPDVQGLPAFLTYNILNICWVVGQHVSLNRWLLYAKHPLWLEKVLLRLGAHQGDGFFLTRKGLLASDPSAAKLSEVTSSASHRTAQRREGHPPPPGSKSDQEPSGSQAALLLAKVTPWALCGHSQHTESIHGLPAPPGPPCLLQDEPHPFPSAMLTPRRPRAGKR